MAAGVRQQHPQAARVFPAQLRRLRRDRRLSQVELADKAGTTQAAVARYENARRIPAPDQLRMLADALGLVGPARGVFYLAAGYAPPGATVSADGSVVFDFDPDDPDAPIIHVPVAAA